MQDIPLYKTFCSSCYWKDRTISSLPQSIIKLDICADCSSVLLFEKWSLPNTSDKVVPLLKANIHKWVKTNVDNKVEVDELNSPDWNDGRPSLSLLVKVTGSSIPIFPPHIESHHLTFNFSFGICKICVKRKSGGDTILQVRALNRELTIKEETYIDKISQNLEKDMSKVDPISFISQRVVVHKGINYKLGSKTLAEAIISNLKKKWVGFTKINYKLTGETKDGTRKYQHTYLFKLPALKTADFAIMGGTIYLVLSILKSGIQVRRIDTGKIKTVKNWKELALFTNYDKRDCLVMSKNETLNSYEVMDTGSYELFEISTETIPKSLNLGEEQTFLRHKMNYYLYSKNVEKDK